MATPKIGQRMRWNDKELSLIKQTFAEQEELLILIRKFLLQGNMTDAELRYLVGVTKNPEVLAIIKKAIHPQLDKQAAAFQTVDLFSSMDFNPTPAEHANLVLKSRMLASDYLQMQFEKLEGLPSVRNIVFDDLLKPVDDYEEAYINIVARNFLLSHIDSQLFNSLAIIAGTKNESPEDQKKRLIRDSNK